MMIVLARIDNRLIHGQVLEAWVPSTRADCIVVANDQVAGLTMQCRLMAAAVPKNIKVFIGTLEEVSSILQSDALAGHRILLLFENSRDALQGHQLGMPFDRLNLGNMHAGDGKVRFSCTLALDGADIENLSRLEEEEGVSIACQCIPADKVRPWRKLIREFR
jgi:PTS system mannose-specific IIB component